MHYFTPDRKEIIRVFMGEARLKFDNPSEEHSPCVSEAIGLVATSIAFEAITHEIPIGGNDHIRGNFCEVYQHIFEGKHEGLNPEIEALMNELRDNPLHDMTPNNPRNPIRIENPNNFFEIIQVVYRVRSNLVHGSKLLDSDRNKVLIRNSFRFLYKLMTFIVAEEKIM